MELLFRHKLLTLLRDRGLLSQERIDLLLSWRNSGFSVHNPTTVYPADTDGLHKLACYLMRAPVNLSRLRFDPDSGLLVYQLKSGHELFEHDAVSDPLEFLARVLIHVPEPNKHLVHFYGAYANRVRRTYRDQIRTEDEDKPPPSRRAANNKWPELIYQVDPLTCDRCGGEMKILAFILTPASFEPFSTIEKGPPPQPRAPPDVSSI